MSNRIITISREFGSGGRTIGRMVAEKLGIPCYDAELIDQIAIESGYAVEYIKEEGEDVTGGWLSTLFADRSMGLTNQDKLWNVQSRVIKELAGKIVYKFFKCHFIENYINYSSIILIIVFSSKPKKLKKHIRYQ